MTTHSQDYRIEGTNVQSGQVTGPGRVNFIHSIQTPNGGVERATSIDIPPSYFQDDPVKIQLLATPIVPVNIGQKVILNFQILSGYPTTLGVMLSTEGDDQTKYILLPERVNNDFVNIPSSISFAIPNLPSKNCFVRIIGLNQNNPIINSISNPSNRFEIISPVVNVNLIINPIKSVVKTEEEIAVRFNINAPIDVDYFLAALSINGQVHSSTIKINDTTARSFLFKIPNQIGQNCNIGIWGIKGNSKVVFGISNPFEIKLGGSNITPTFNLITPKDTDDLHVGDTINIKFELIPNTFIVQDLDIAFSSDNSRYAIIPSNFNNFSGRGTLPFVIPQCKEFWLRFVATSGISNTFGPFKTGNKVTPNPVVDTELERHLKQINELVSSIRLPAGSSKYSSKVDVGVFLYNLMTTNEVDNYFFTVRRLEEIESAFENPLIKDKLSKGKYQDFKANLQELKGIQKKFSGLENKAQIKQNLTILINLFQQSLNDPEIIDLFKDQQKVQNLKKLDPRTILRNVIYLSWIMEHSKEIDDISIRRLGHNSLLNFSDLYNSLKLSMTEIKEMYDKLQDTRKIVKSLIKSQ